MYEKFDHRLLKPFKNKKGQKKFPGAPFSMSFSELLAVKKDTEKGALRKFFWSFLLCDDFSTKWNMDDLYGLKFAFTYVYISLISEW